jgi:hypothetical protein
MLQNNSDQKKTNAEFMEEMKTDIKSGLRLWLENYGR